MPAPRFVPDEHQQKLLDDLRAAATALQEIEREHARIRQRRDTAILAAAEANIAITRIADDALIARQNAHTLLRGMGFRAER